MLESIYTNKFKVHSTRAASTSHLAANNIEISSILKYVGWSNERTFQTFYHKQLEKPVFNFGSALLESVNKLLRSPHYIMFKVMCWKFECRYDIHYKTQTGTSCEKCNSKAFRLGIKPATSGLPDQCSTTELQKPLPTTWARVQYIY